MLLKKSTLLIFAFATVFFPRILTYYGAPNPVNFIHFLCIPILTLYFLFTLRTGRTTNNKILKELIYGTFALFLSMAISALINDAGFINLLLQFLISIEPFLFLIALLCLPMAFKIWSRLEKLYLIFASSNLVLALAQSVLIPAGVFPRRGGTIQDNIAGVFVGTSGSAGNYVSCAISLLATLYFFVHFKSYSVWIRTTILLLALFQIQVSDSKQVLLAFSIGALILIIPLIKTPKKALPFSIAVLALFIGIAWIYMNFDVGLLRPYRNWIEKDGIYSLDGIAIRTKTAAIPIIVSYLKSPLNWLFGLGPGHTVTRLGGWMLEKYSYILVPAGATIHPASEQVSRIFLNTWISQESTIFSPLFTWVGLWGDIGFMGLLAYLSLVNVIWRRLCKTYYSKFLLLSTASFGFILTQMEEPAYMLSVIFMLVLDYWRKTGKNCDV